MRIEQTHHIRPALGLNPGKLPDKHIEQMFHDGFEFKLLSRAEAQAKQGHNRRPHRLYVKCPTCFDFVPAGRLQQHTKRKDH